MYSITLVLVSRVVIAVDVERLFLDLGLGLEFRLGLGRRRTRLNSARQLIRRARVFQLAVRARAAVHTLEFQHAVRTGFARRAVAFHLAVRAGAA